MPVFLSPEISARRVSGLIQIFQSERGESTLGNPFYQFLEDQVLQNILTDSNFWIPQDLEDRIISVMSTMDDLSGMIYQLGRETFLTNAYGLLPDNGNSLEIKELISRIPILMNRLTRATEVRIHYPSEKEAIFQFYFPPPYRERWYDGLFFKGMLEGLALLYQLEEPIVELTATRLMGIHVEHRELGRKIQFGADTNEYRFQWKESIRLIGKTNDDFHDQFQSEKTFVVSSLAESDKKEFTVVNVQSLVEKSRVLAIENRDLEAAVEVLKSFKSQLEQKQKLMDKDLKLAKNIQKGIIPQIIPDWKGMEFWTYFAPMQEVSGDFYDYLSFNNGKKLGIMLCDVSGHGVPAAFITALSKMLFGKYKLSRPSEIFKNLNREFLDLVKQQCYTTSLYLIVDENYKVTYSIAGHPRPLLLRYKTGRVEVLEGEGTFIGMFPDAADTYEDYTIQLEPGDKLFLYTDGITEGQNDKDEHFGLEILIGIIETTHHLNSKDSTETIIKQFNDFCRGTDQGDDITLICLGLSPRIPEIQMHTKEGIDDYNEGRYKEAADHFKTAHSIMPRELTILMHLARSYAKAEEYEKAIEILSNYNKFRTNNEESHSLLGYCCYKMQNYTYAESELRIALSIDDDNVTTIYNLAKVYSKTDQANRIPSLLEKILRLRPNYKPAKEWLAQLGGG